MGKFIIIGVILTIILSFLFIRFSPVFNSQDDQITITYWDFWDENLIRPVLTEYEKLHPDVKISYSSQSQLNYRSRLSTQLKQGTGPDVFPIHNSWLPLLITDLSPSPNITIGEYKSSFYPVAFASFVSGNEIYAAPLGIDGLALFVNEEILTAAGQTEPKDWTEFISTALRVTVKDSSGLIKTAGAGLGTVENVDYWSDILGLLLLQQQTVNLKDPASKSGAEVLAFYTGFVIDPTKKVWDVNLPSTTEMFISGRLAFYFAPYSKAAEIKTANPSLKFKILPVPQLPDGKIAFASFFGEAVSNKGKYSKQSWEFVEFLTSKEVSRVFANPNARMDLAPEQIQDPLRGAFVTQGPMYKFWYLSEMGSDGGGINDEIIKTWGEAVNGVLQGNRPEGSLTKVSQDTKATLEKYGVK